MSNLIAELIGHKVKVIDGSGEPKYGILKEIFVDGTCLIHSPGMYQEFFYAYIRDVERMDDNGNV